MKEACDYLRRIKSFLKRQVATPLVSVIVPTYNGGKTIAKCLDSLLGQSQRRIRIICVNDGSTDNTLRIIKKYRRKNRRIRIINQKNQGRAAARNAGLRAVRTKYVMFCDDDDLYEESMCENMIDVIEKSKADFAVCGINVIYKAHEEMRESDEKYYKLYFDGLQEVNDGIINKIDASVCNKIFRMSIIRENEISFPDGLNNEDYYFCNAYMSVAKTVFFLKQKLYCYIRRKGSIMSDNFDGTKESIDHLLVAEKLFRFYKKIGFLNKHRDLFWRQWISSFWSSFRYSDKKYRYKIKEEAMKFLSENYEKYEPKEEELRRWKSDIIKTLDKIKGEKNGKL